MKKYSIIILLCFCFNNLFSQIEVDSITIVKKTSYQNSKILESWELTPILSTNSATLYDFKIYKRNNFTGTALKTTGYLSILAASFLTLAASLKETSDFSNGNFGKADYSAGLRLSVVGLGLVISSIPFKNRGKKHLKRSIDIYNSGIKDTGHVPGSFNLVINSGQLGVLVKF